LNGGTNEIGGFVNLSFLNLQKFKKFMAKKI